MIRVTLESNKHGRHFSNTNVFIMSKVIYFLRLILFLSSSRMILSLLGCLTACQLYYIMFHVSLKLPFIIKKISSIFNVRLDFNIYL